MDVARDVSLHKILQLCGQIAGKLAVGADMYLLCLKCVVHTCMQKYTLDAVLKFSYPHGVCVCIVPLSITHQQAPKGPAQHLGTGVPELAVTNIMHSGVRMAVIRSCSIFFVVSVLFCQPNREISRQCLLLDTA